METQQPSNQQEILTQESPISEQIDNQKICKELEDEINYWKNIFPKIYYDLGAGGI